MYPNYVLSNEDAAILQKIINCLYQRLVKLFTELNGKLQLMSFKLEHINILHITKHLGLYSNFEL